MQKNIKILISLEMSPVHNPEKHSSVLLKVPYRCWVSHWQDYIPYSNTFCFIFLFEDQAVK